MLISVMGSTFGKVMEHRDRNTLIAKTVIMSWYVYICKLDTLQLSENRYVYIA
jgi:hypothetical protein